MLRSGTNGATNASPSQARHVAPASSVPSRSNAEDDTMRRSTLTVPVNSTATTGDRLLRIREIVLVTSLGRSTIYAMTQAGMFPAPVKVGAASLWRASAVQDWMGSLEPTDGA